MSPALEPQYFELADGCYFIDYANLIVNPEKGLNWHLTPAATHFVRILLAKVDAESVAGIAAKLSKESTHFVQRLIEELKAKALIIPAEAPAFGRESEALVVPGVRQATITATIPIPTSPIRWHMAAIIPTSPSRW